MDSKFLMLKPVQFFFTSMKKKFNCPTIQSVPIKDYKVYRFPFKEMLQDLLYSLKDKIHIYNHQIDTVNGDCDELWCTNWMKLTYDQKPINSETHIYLPLIMYSDKTGTDAYQRNRLEP